MLDLDGKLYDAYVAYPQPYDLGFNKEVETFALKTLPHVLEMACDYKLFIAGRDCLPGECKLPTANSTNRCGQQQCLKKDFMCFFFKHKEITAFL